MFYEPLLITDTPYRITSKWAQFPTHWHSELELHMCLHGNIMLKVEDQPYTMTPGQILIIPGYAAHSLEDSTDDFQRVSVTFGYALLGNHYNAIQNTFYCSALQDAPEGIQTACRLLLEGFQGCGCVNTSNDWKIRSALFMLADQLRSGQSLIKATEELQNRAQQLGSIYTVLEYVAAHYADKLTVDQAAEIAGYAKTYFCRQFKLTTGISFHRYLNNYRISMACLLLQDQSLPISQIATQTGFSSAKLFCRTFKEVTGMTTGQYQKLPVEERNLQWPH